MENLLLLGVPILKHITVNLLLIYYLMQPTVLFVTVNRQINRSIEKIIFFDSIITVFEPSR